MSSGGRKHAWVCGLLTDELVISCQTRGLCRARQSVGCSVLVYLRHIQYVGTHVVTRAVVGVYFDGARSAQNAMIEADAVSFDEIVKTFVLLCLTASTIGERTRERPGPWRILQLSKGKDSLRIRGWPQAYGGKRLNCDPRRGGPSVISLFFVSHSRVPV